MISLDLPSIVKVPNTLLKTIPLYNGAYLNSCVMYYAVPSRGRVAGVKLRGPGLKGARENFAIAKLYSKSRLLDVHSFAL